MVQLASWQVPRYWATALDLWEIGKRHACVYMCTYKCVLQVFKFKFQSGRRTQHYLSAAYPLAGMASSLVMKFKAARGVLLGLAWRRRLP
jgi:hypothetical protein